MNEFNKIFFSLWKSCVFVKNFLKRDSVTDNGEFENKQRFF